jgi:hypothetical protein
VEPVALSGDAVRLFSKGTSLGTAGAHNMQTEVVGSFAQSLQAFVGTLPYISLSPLPYTSSAIHSQRR